MLISELEEPFRSKLSAYHTVTSLPVQWGDQDAFGHVNNVTYFRWLESARIDLLAACPSQVTMAGSGPGPIVASLTCDYRRQLHFPDQVLIGSRVDRIGRSSADLVHAIVSVEQQEVVAEGRCVIVVYDYTSRRVCRIPEDLRQAFEQSMELVRQQESGQ